MTWSPSLNTLILVAEAQTSGFSLIARRRRLPMFGDLSQI
jgi:hypothetical protein